MKTIIDFFAELSISSNATLEEINKNLAQLEKDWTRRQINNPEKATKMLAYIIDARRVFKTETARSEYEQALEESRKKVIAVDSDEERKENAKKWFREALQYFVNHQNDLAVEAIGRTLQYCQEGDENYGEIHEHAAVAYERVGDYSTAFSCVNKAIMTDPTHLDYYKTKAGIYSYMKFKMLEASESGQNINVEEYQSLVKKYRDELYGIMRMAQDANDLRFQEYAWDELSLTLYWDEPREIAKAEQYANMVLNALKEQHSGYWVQMFEGKLAKRVLDDIQQEKAEFQSYQGTSHPSTSSGGGCYIATAVYGSYDCPEVWILRRYRDNVLTNTWYGRLFVRVYYAISPRIVSRVGNQKWFKRKFRKKLDIFVNKLKSKGFSDNPYCDVQ